MTPKKCQQPLEIPQDTLRLPAGNLGSLHFPVWMVYIVSKSGSLNRQTGNIFGKIGHRRAGGGYTTIYPPSMTISAPVM